MSRFMSLTAASILLISAGCSSTTSTNVNDASNIVSTGDSAKSSPASGAKILSDRDGALMVAASKGDLATVKSLVDKGVNVNTQDERGSTPLMEAVWAGHADVVNFLIERKADVNVKKTDGSSALTVAKSKNNRAITEAIEKAVAH